MNIPKFLILTLTSLCITVLSSTARRRFSDEVWVLHWSLGIVISHFIFMSIPQNNSSSFSHMRNACLTSSSWPYWQYQVWVSSCEAGLKSKQKWLVAPITFMPLLDISCQSDNYYCSQHSWLRWIDGHFSLPVMCLTSSNCMSKAFLHCEF